MTWAAWWKSSFHSASNKTTAPLASRSYMPDHVAVVLGGEMNMASRKALADLERQLVEKMDCRLIANG